MSGTVEISSPPGSIGYAPVVCDPGLDALVRLSAGLALGSRFDLGPLLQAAAEVADPIEVEEALLQSYLFLGFPTALNALARWRRVSERPAPPEFGAEDGVDRWIAAGEETCRAVYGSAYEGLRGNIAAMKPEMERWMRTEGYGKVLSRPGLSLGRRECCIVAILAVQDVPVQLRSHLRGALRCGAEVEVIDAVLEAVEEFEEEGARERTRETWTLVRASREEEG